MKTTVHRHLRNIRYTLWTVTKNRVDDVSMTFQILFTSSVSFSNIELPRTTGTIRHSTQRSYYRIHHYEGRVARILLHHVACLCWEFGSSSFPAVQLTLFYSRASKCWPPASKQASWTVWQYFSTHDDAHFENTVTPRLTSDPANEVFG